MPADYISRRVTTDDENISIFGFFPSDVDDVSMPNALISKEVGPNYSSIFWDCPEIETTKHIEIIDHILLDYPEISYKNIDICFYFAPQHAKHPVDRKVVHPPYLPLKNSLKPFISQNSITFFRLNTILFSICIDVKIPNFRESCQVGIVFHHKIDRRYLTSLWALYNYTRTPIQIDIYHNRKLKQAFNNFCMQ